VGVLDACHSAGLMVVVSVCDTGANSVKAKKWMFPERHQWNTGKMLLTRQKVGFSLTKNTKTVPR